MPIFENCKKPNTSKVTAKEPANDTRNTEKPEALGQKSKTKSHCQRSTSVDSSKPESAKGFLVLLASMHRSMQNNSLREMPLQPEANECFL